MSEEKFVIHQVPQAVIDHLIPDDIDPRIELRPIVLLDVPKHEPKTIYFSTPGRDDNFSHRYFTGVRDRMLFGEFPHPEIEPPEFGEIFFPTVRLDPWMIHGRYGETTSWFDRWMNGFSLGYYGFKSTSMWDHYEWLGDEQLHHTERLSSIDSFRRGVLRVKVPAIRYAGLNAYELDNLFYLKEKKPRTDYAHWILQHLLTPDYLGEKVKWFRSLIQSGLDQAFSVVKKPAVRMSGRPKLRR